MNLQKFASYNCTTIVTYKIRENIEKERKYIKKNIKNNKKIKLLVKIVIKKKKIIKKNKKIKKEKEKY
jgi:hypothetical protein